MAEQDFITAYVTKFPYDKVISQYEVQIEVSKDGTGFRKAKKSGSLPRNLVLTKYKLLLLESSGKKAIKESKIVEIHYLDIVSVELMEENKRFLIKHKQMKGMGEAELQSDVSPQIAEAIRAAKSETVPDWPEIPVIGQPLSGKSPIVPSNYATFRTTYITLCNYYNLPVNELVCMFIQNLYENSITDFIVADLPGIDTNGNSERDPLYLSLAPLIVALRYDTYFTGFMANNITGRKELIGLIALIMRNNSTLRNLQVTNSDSDATGLLELALALKENRRLQLQILDLSDHKNMDQRFLSALGSILTTYPSSRLTHLNLARCGVPAKGLTKLFTAFQMNYFISLGITCLNLSGCKFDADSTAALELWLELGGNYSHIEELVLSNVSQLPFKLLPKFKGFSKLSKLDLSFNKLDSSGEIKFLVQLLSESPSVQTVDLSYCSIERSSHVEMIITEGIKKMKADALKINLSGNPGFASDGKWARTLQGCRLHSITLNEIHFKESALDELVTAFKTISTLERICLNECKTKPKNLDLVSTLAEYPALKSLSLSNSWGEQYISHLIKDLCDRNKSITDLDISNNMIGDEGASHLAKLLRTSTLLVNLNCDGNGFTFSAWQALYQALVGNKSMHTIVFPQQDMLLIQSQSSESRRGVVMKLILDLQTLLQRFNREDAVGSWIPPKIKESVVTPATPATLANIPSHLASQQSEMKLEDFGDIGLAVTSPVVGENGNSLDATQISPRGVRQPSLRQPFASSTPPPRPSTLQDLWPGVSVSGSGAPCSGPKMPLAHRPPNANFTIRPPSNPPPRPTAPTNRPSLGTIYMGPTTSRPPSTKPPLPGVSSPAPSGISSPTPWGPAPGRAMTISVSSLPQVMVDDVLLAPMNITYDSYGQYDEEIDPEETVRQATLNEMVIRLAHEGSSDVKFMHTYLLTYRAIVEPAELLDRLITRFFLPPPPGGFLSSTDQKQWQEQKLRPIRLRVMNVLKRWCETHWQDFDQDPSLIETLTNFLKDPAVTKQYEGPANLLVALISKCTSNIKSPLISRTLRGNFKPDSLLDTTGSSSSGLIGILSKYTPSEIAEQMCLLESDLFCSLAIKEFFNQSWNKGTNEQKDKAAPNIRLMIKVSNHLITWIAWEVVRQPSASGRTKAITRAIELCEELKARNNINGLKEISAGLSLSSIQRLKKAWSGVKPKYMQQYTDYTDLCQNLTQLRSAVHNAAPPLVPYLGVYLTDLVFIEDGNSNTLDEDGVSFINFRKMSIMGEVLMEISSYQQDKYCFFKIDELYNFFLLGSPKEEEDLQKLSLAAEARVQKVPAKSR